MARVRDRVRVRVRDRDRVRISLRLTIIRTLTLTLNNDYTTLLISRLYCNIYTCTFLGIVLLFRALITVLAMPCMLCCPYCSPQDLLLHSANKSKHIPGIFVFLYADDILILSPTVSKLQEFLNVIELNYRP